jgi:hypothetical protein
LRGRFVRRLLRAGGECEGQQQQRNPSAETHGATSGAR